MKRILRTFVAAALALWAVTPIAIAPAGATTYIGQVLCAPEPTVGTAGPRHVVNTSSTASPQPSYNLNASGCAYIANGDVGFFLSQGYTQGPNLFALQVVANGTSTNATNSPTLPANTYIHNIIVTESGDQSVIGGLSIGTAITGTNIVNAFVVSSNFFGPLSLIPNGNGNPAGTAIQQRTFNSAGSPVSAQIFVTCTTSCVGAVLNVSVLYSYF